MKRRCSTKNGCCCKRSSALCFDCCKSLSHPAISVVGRRCCAAFTWRVFFRGSIPQPRFEERSSRIHPCEDASEDRNHAWQGEQHPLRLHLKLEDERNENAKHHDDGEVNRSSRRDLAHRCCAASNARAK